MERFAFDLLWLWQPVRTWFASLGPCYAFWLLSTRDGQYRVSFVIQSDTEAVESYTKLSYDVRACQCCHITLRDLASARQAPFRYSYIARLIATNELEVLSSLGYMHFDKT